MTPPIAPSSPMSAADELAHLAASYVRTAPGGSGRDSDTLRRARGFTSAGSVR